MKSVFCDFINSIPAPSFSGKPPNEFAFDGRPKERDFALKVVADVHEQWKALMGREGDSSVVRACTQYECASKINPDTAQAVLDEQPDPGEDVELESVVDKNHFVKL